MRNLLSIAFAIIVAAVCSQPLMAGLQHLMLPHGLKLSVFSPAEPFAALAMFALFLCACAGLAAAVGCYLCRYSMAMRRTIVLLPMLAAAFLATMVKATQFRDAVSAAESLGMSAAFSLRQASFHAVPAAAFVAGLLAIAVAILLRARNGQSAAPNGGPATPVGNSAVTEESPSVRSPR